MSWFFLATPLRGGEKPSESYSLDELESEVFKDGSKSVGDINKVKLDKRKFKFGTLNLLMKLNDALGKVDHTLEGVIRKVQKQAEEIKAEALSELVQDLEEKLSNFQWDDTKYPRSRSLGDIAAMISERMNSADSEMKKFTEEYNNIKNQLYQYKKREEGNFLSRDLGDIIYGKVAKKNFVVGSKFLVNVLIVVNKSKVSAFESSYESVGEGVVPRSARHLDLEDKDGNQLFRVVVMENSVDSFLIKCKQKIGFTARKFVYDEEKYNQEMEEAEILEAKLNKLTGKLQKRCFFTFSDLIIASLHLKVIRAYVDGALRFGVPPQFLLTVIRGKKGSEKKILKSLVALFVDEKMRDMYGTKEELGDSEDFFPFVYIPINTL